MASSYFIATALLHSIQIVRRAQIHLYDFNFNGITASVLLSRQYLLTDIDLEELTSAPLSGVRSNWLSFCETRSVPESGPLMILASSAIYEFLPDYFKNFQNTLQ